MRHLIALAAALPLVAGCAATGGGGSVDRLATAQIILEEVVLPELPAEDQAKARAVLDAIEAARPLVAGLRDGTATQAEVIDALAAITVQAEALYAEMSGGPLDEQAARILRIARAAARIYATSNSSDGS